MTADVGWRDVAWDLEVVVASIEREIRNRRAGQAFAPTPASAAVPGDALVELAGYASLLASPRARQVLEQCLWPRVRETVGVDAPTALVRGDYRSCLAITRAALEPPVQKQVMPSRLAAFKWSKAGSGRPPTRLELASATALRVRLNAGLFLAGLEALWGDEGLSATRSLWHDRSLHEWDRYLVRHSGKLRRTLIAEQVVPAGVPLSASPWLKPLLSLVPESTRLGARGNPLSTERVERALLVDDLLRRNAQPEADTDWTVSSPEGMPGSCVVVRGAAGGIVAVWIATTSDELVRIPEEWALLLDGIVLGERVELDGSDEEPDESKEPVTVHLLRLIGSVDAASLLAAPTSRRFVELARSAFMGNHEQAASFLAAVVIPLSPVRS